MEPLTGGRQALMRVTINKCLWYVFRGITNDAVTAANSQLRDHLRNLQKTRNNCHLCTSYVQLCTPIDPNDRHAEAPGLLHLFFFPPFPALPGAALAAGAGAAAAGC